MSQTGLGAGKVGFITRFNGSALFDNVSVTEHGGASQATFDTFEDGNATGWTPEGGGTWSVVTDGTQVYRQADNAVQANRSVLGGTNWTDQTVEASAKLESSSGTNRFFGVVARYNAPGDYYYLIMRTNNTIELKRLDGGLASILDSKTYPVNSATWYSLKLEIVGTTLNGYVNGQLELQATDSTYGSGSAALLTHYTAVSFDDVYVDSNLNVPLLLADDFQDGDANGWTPGGTSSWSVVTDGTLAYRQADTSASAYASAGGGSWTDQIIELDAKAVTFDGSDRWFGIAARYTDEDNHYYVTLRSSNVVELKKMVSGAYSTLDDNTVTVTTGTWYTIKFVVIGNSLKVYIDGELKLQATDSDLSSGGAGLRMYRTLAIYDNVLVTAP